MGVKAEEAEQAQHVFHDPFVRIADEAHMAAGQILNAAEWIVDHAFGRACECIEREITARGIGRPVVGIGYARAPAQWLDVNAQRGDLESRVARNGGDGAMRDPSRQGAQPRPLKQADHRLRRIGCRDVDVGDRPVTDGIADAAANETNLLAIRGQRPHDAHGVRRAHPGLDRDLADGVIGGRTVRGHGR